MQAVISSCVPEFNQLMAAVSGDTDSAGIASSAVALAAVGGYSYRIFKPSKVSAVLLVQCANLFSSQYGVWSSLPEVAPQLAAMKAKPGTPVKMSADRMRKMLLFDNSCEIVVCMSRKS